MASESSTSSMETEGLRDRKKRQTREALAKAAADLFRARGYENVRMKDVADAANVSEQTLYNYFPTKEHLIFDQQQELESRILSVVICKRKGMPLSQALRQGASQLLDDLSHAVGKRKGIPDSVLTGVELRRVWMEMNARHADSLADALLETDRIRDRATSKFLARSIVALFAAIFEGVGEMAIAGRSRASIRKRLNRSIKSITSLIENGFGE